MLASYNWAIAPPVNGPLNIATVPANGNATNPPPHLLGAIANTGNTAGSVTYTITPTSIFNCVGEPFDLTINVNPQPLVNNATATVCSDVAINTLLPNDNNGPSVAANGYSITAIANAANLVSSAGNPGLWNDTSNAVLLDDAWHNPTAQNQTIVYTIVPSALNTGCAGNPFTLTATIQPEATIADVTYTVCSRQELGAAVNFVSSGANASNFIVNNLLPAPSANNSIYAGGPILTTWPNTLNQNSFFNDAFINQGATLNTITYQITPYTINGCVGDQFQMTVNVRPEPVGLDSTYSFCSNAPFEIDLQQQVNNGGNALYSSYSWTLTPAINGALNLTTLPANGASGNPPPHLIGAIQNFGPNPGNVTYSIIPTSTFNCVGEPFYTTININPLPVNGDINISVCSENPLEFNLPNNGSTYDLISLSNPGATPMQPIVFATNQPFNFLYNDAWLLSGSSPQTVVYGLSATNNFNCSSNFDLNVQVNPLPVIDFNILNNVLCANSNLQFNSTSSPALNYEWNFDDGNYAYVPDPLHTYANPGIYDVVLTGTDTQNGCTDSLIQQVQVNYTPSSSFQISETSGCDLLEVTFTAADANNDWDYDWDFGNGLASTDEIIAMTQFTTQGCYDVSLTITTNEGCTSTSNQIDAVCMYDTPTANFSLSSYTVDEFNTEVQTINQSINATNYVWNFGDGYSSTQIQPTHIYNDADATYNVELTAYNEVGCFDVAVVNVSSIQSLVVYVPNTFTPNEDEYNQVFKPIISGAYKPNSYHLTVFNRWGEIVFESFDPNYGWDGMYGDQRCQFGTYTWKLSLDALQSGETKNYHGHVTLLR